MPRFAPGLVVLFGVLLVGAPTRADPARKIGVIAGVRVNLSDARVAEIVEDFERVLEREREVEIVVGSASALKGGKSGGMCSMDSRCLEGVAARLGVDELLFLVVVGAGDRVRVDFSRLDRVGKVSHPPALILAPDSKRRDAEIAKAIETLLPDAPARAAVEPPVEDDPPVTEDDPPVDDSVPVINDGDGDGGDGDGKRKDDSAGRGKRMTGLVISAVGVGVVGGAIYFMMGARSAADDLNRQCGSGCTWNDELQGLYDDHGSKKTIALTLGIVGAAAIVGGGTLYALGRAERNDASDSSISLSLGADSGSIVWSGGF